MKKLMLSILTIASLIVGSEALAADTTCLYTDAKMKPIEITIPFEEVGGILILHFSAPEPDRYYMATNYGKDGADYLEFAGVPKKPERSPPHILNLGKLKQRLAFRVVSTKPKNADDPHFKCQEQ
jgi:hypothetical protein